MSQPAQAAIAVIPTTDLEALALYHRGRELFADRTDPQSASEAEVALEAAVEADPEFAAAWAELTKARSWLLSLGTADEAGVQEALRRTKELAAEMVEARKEMVRVYRDIRNPSPAYRLAVSQGFQPLKILFLFF